MKIMRSAHAIRTSAVLAVAGLANAALATEGVGSIHPNGAENFSAGAMPPARTVTGAKLLGGNLSPHAIVPVVNLKVPIAADSPH